MKAFARLSLMGSGLGLIMLTAVPSFATVVPAITPISPTSILNTGGDGTVTVTQTDITFTKDDTNTGSSTEVGVGTTLSYSGGPLVPGQPININGGSPITPIGLPIGGAYPVSVPVTFPDSPGLVIQLTSFGPGTTNTNCSGLTSGQSCSPLTPLGPSPIILTAVGGGTTAILPVTGVEMDNGKTVADVTGQFSANIAGQTPLELSTVASFTTTTAAQLTLTARSAVPEPRTVSLVLLAGLFMGIVVMKKRQGNEA